MVVFVGLKCCWSTGETPVFRTHRVIGGSFRVILVLKSTFGKDVRNMKAWLKEFWCAWTHGGGGITRDGAGRINWQCARCGRWSVPVSHEDERKVADSEIERYRRRAL